MEPVYRGMEVGSRAALRLLGSRLTVHGSLQLPESTGAVVAINHTSYLDFMPAALAVNSNKRRLRFMIKAEMKDVPGVNFLITRSKTIPVDRSAGAGAYAVAVDNLRAGRTAGYLLGRLAGARQGPVLCLLGSRDYRGQRERVEGCAAVLGERFPQLGPLVTVETGEEPARTARLVGDPKVGSRTRRALDSLFARSRR